MKILLIVDDYLPDSIKVAAKMMHELGVEFVSHGASVTVITPACDLNCSLDVSTLDGVTVCRFRSGGIKNVPKLKRAINETLLPFRAWKSLRNYLNDNPHDLIVYYSPSIFWAPLVKKLRKVWQVPSYLILRDLFPQWVIDNGMLKANSPIVKYFKFFERMNYAAADTIGLQCPQNKVWFLKNNSYSNQTIEVLYNWARVPEEPIESGYHRKMLGLSNEVVFFYGGNIGHAQDMMNIMRLAIQLRDEPKAYFVLVGEGDEVGLVRDTIEQEQLMNTVLLPSVSQEKFKKMLSEFDVGLFSLHKDHTTQNFPGKLLGYMAQETPILGSINKGNDLKQVIENAEAGFVSVNSDDKALLNNALILLRDDELRKSMGKNAKCLLQRTFSVKAAAEQILASVDV